MKKYFIILMVISGLFLNSCDKEKTTSKVIFYTNAQVMLNCGSFDVEIYIDNTLVGVIEESFYPLGSVPDCNDESSETLLVINKPEGNYEFTAQLCSETLGYMGDFNVKSDSCSLVFIDLTYGQ